jgi:hypothetical protein
MVGFITGIVAGALIVAMGAFTGEIELFEIAEVFCVATNSDWTVVTTEGSTPNAWRRRMMHAIWIVVSIVDKLF